MTHDEQGRYSKKETAAGEHDPRVLAAVERAAGGGGLACADAERLAADTGAGQGAIGAAADSREIKLVGCQLGLFGYETADGRHPAFGPAGTVAPGLERRLGEVLVDGRLPCAAAWAVAAELRIARIDVARAAEALRLKISRCQLGAF
jgi:hypothetical protein